MKAGSVITTLLVFVCLSVSAAGQDRFIDDLPDVPLMAGLQERTRDRLVFDKEDGRIVQTFLVGRVTPTAARQFYVDSLPPLGWSLIRTTDRTLQFKREGDQLTLEYRKLDKSLEIMVFIEPTQR